MRLHSACASRVPPGSKRSGRAGYAGSEVHQRIQYLGVGGGGGGGGGGVGLQKVRRSPRVQATFEDMLIKGHLKP